VFEGLANPPSLGQEIRIGKLAEIGLLCAR